MQYTSDESSVTLRWCALRQKWLQCRDFLGLEVAAGLPLSKLPVRPPIITHTERGCTYNSYCCLSKAQQESVGVIKSLSMVQFHLDSTQLVSCQLKLRAERVSTHGPMTTGTLNTLKTQVAWILKHLYTKLHPSNLSAPSNQASTYEEGKLLCWVSSHWWYKLQNSGNQTCWSNCTLRIKIWKSAPVGLNANLDLHQNVVSPSEIINKCSLNG